MRTWSGGLRLVVVMVGLAAAIPAADPFYLGRWNIASAAVAPWWREREKPDASETKELVGKSIVIGAKGIEGPRQAACARPKYKVVDSPAEGLFQGMFDEMHRRDRSVDARKVAESVGFRGSHWKSLETGCPNELDYHFLDEHTAAFGLNNYIYLLRRQ